MNYIIEIIKKYRAKNANQTLLKDFISTFIFFLLLYLFFSLFEFVYYLDPIKKTKIFNFYFSSLSLTILFIITKWFITINSFFNYKNDIEVAREIWDTNSNIKDKLLNIIQINKQKNSNNSDLKQYALKKLQGDLKKYLKPNQIYYFGKNINLISGIFFLFILLILTTSFENAIYRLYNYKKEFDPPLPFTLTSLSGDFTGLSGDTLSINISGLGIIPDSIDIYWTDETNIINNARIKHIKQIYNYKFINLNTTTTYWAEYQNPSFFPSWDKIVINKNLISIKKRPIIQNIKFKINPPNYTNLPPYTHDQYNMNQIEILKGSIVNIQASSTKDLHLAWMVNNDDRINLSINKNNLNHEFILDENINVALYCIDNDLISNINPIQFSLIAKNDNPPIINIQTPSYEFELNEELTIPIKANIYDDYGINKMWLEYQIISQDIIGNSEKIKKIVVEGFIDSHGQIYLNKNWDINSLGMLMGDEIHFWICAEDQNNISGPGVTKSIKLIGKFPSLEDLFSRVEEYEDDIETIVDDIEDSLEEISEVAEEIILESLKTNDLSWEQEKKLEKTFDEAHDMVAQIKEIQDNINQILEQNNENNLFDSDLLEKFDQFNDLLQNMMTDELLEAIDKLQEAFQNLDQNKLMDALKNYEFNIEKFEEELDRFIDMFELALAEQKLNELSEHMENMINKQTKLIDDIQKNNNQYALEKKSKKQEYRFSEFEDILEDAEKKLDDISNNTSNQLSDLLHSELNKETSSLLESQTSDIKDNNNNSTNKESALSNLNDISNILNEISEQFKNESAEKMTKEFIIIVDNLLTISNQQEKLNLETKGVRSNSPELRSINQEQNNIDRSLNQIMKQLIDLSNQTFFVDQKINRNIGKLKNSISKTITNIEQKKIGTARKNQTENLKYINEITFLLLLSMEEMQNSSSASGFEKFMESLENMTEQQQGINQGTMQLSQMGMMQQQSILDQLMQQQQQLQDQLGELLKNNPGEDSGGLPQVQEDMEEIIQDFKHKNINAKTIERQEKILSKMLDSQKSLTKKDFSEKRKNKVSEDITYSGPSDISKDYGNEELFLINAMESAIQEGLSEEYKKLIRLYFLELQKENNDIK